MAFISTFIWSICSQTYYYYTCLVLVPADVAPGDIKGAMLVTRWGTHPGHLEGSDSVGSQLHHIHQCHMHH